MCHGGRSCRRGDGIAVGSEESGYGFRGRGRSFGDTCGAVTGAVLAVGAVHGRPGLPEGEGQESIKKAVDELYGKRGLYRLFNQIPNRLADKYGKTLCRELTAKWQESWLCRDHALFCRELITDAAEIAAELAFTKRDEAASRPFRRNVENLRD